MRRYPPGNGLGASAHPGAEVLKKSLGLKWRCSGAIPLPPKKTVAEHVATQAEFLADKLEPTLEQARCGQGHVFFVDPAHFVMGSFFCCVCGLVRLMIRGASALEPYTLLGDWVPGTERPA